MGEIFENNPEVSFENQETGNNTPIITGNKLLDAKLQGMSNDERDEVFKQLNAPLSGEEVAQLIDDGHKTGYMPSEDEFYAYNDFKKTIHSDFWGSLPSALIGLVNQNAHAAGIIAGRSLTPKGQLQNIPDAAEAVARNLRNWGDMLFVSENPDSVIFQANKKLAMLAQSQYGYQPKEGEKISDYDIFKTALRFNYESKRLAEGDSSVLVPKEYIDNDVAEAAGMWADPTLLFGIGEAKDVANVALKVGTVAEQAATKAAINASRLSKFQSWFTNIAERTNQIKRGVLGGTLKMAGMPIEFVGRAVQDSIDFATHQAGRAVEGLTGVPINDFTAASKIGTMGAGIIGGANSIAGKMGSAYLIAGGVKGIGESMKAIGTQIIKNERGIASYAELALKQAELSGSKLSKPAQNILKILQNADPLLMYASDIGHGALHGAVLGGVLGYAKDETEGFKEGVKGGIGMGGIGGAVGGAWRRLNDSVTASRAAITAKLVLEGWKTSNPENYKAAKAMYDYVAQNRGNDQRYISILNKMFAGIDRIAPDLSLHVLSPEEFINVLESRGLDENGRVQDATIGSLSKLKYEDRVVVMSLLRDYGGNYIGRPEDFDRDVTQDVRNLSPEQQDLLKKKVSERPVAPTQSWQTLPYGSQERIDAYNQELAVKRWDRDHDETHFRNGYAKPAWMLRSVEERPQQYSMPYDQWRRLSDEEKAKVAKQQADSKFDVKEWDRKFAHTHDEQGNPLKGEKLYNPEDDNARQKVQELQTRYKEAFDSKVESPEGDLRLKGARDKWKQLSPEAKQALKEVLATSMKPKDVGEKNRFSNYWGHIQYAERVAKGVLDQHNGNVDTKQTPDVLKAQRLAKGFIDDNRNPDGSLTDRGKILVRKLAHEGFVDEKGNILNQRNPQKYPITLSDLEGSKGIATDRDSNNKLHIFINKDRFTSDTFAHEVFHSIFRNTAMRDMFINPLKDELLGVWVDGKRIQDSKVHPEELRNFYKAYYEKLLKAQKQFSPEALKSYMDEFDNAVNEFKNWNESKVLSSSSAKILNDAVEEFGANYFGHWMLGNPSDYVFRGGNLTGIRGVFDDVKHSWLNYWQSKMEYENPQFDFSRGLDNAFYKSGEFKTGAVGDRTSYASLDYMMRDILRASANMTSGTWSPLNMSRESALQYVKANGMWGVLKFDASGKPKIMSEAEYRAANRKAGLQIHKIISALPAEDREGLTMDADGNFRGRFNDKILSIIVQSGWRDQAWADKIRHAYRILDGQAENVVEAGYLGNEAHIYDDKDYPRLKGNQVPFKNRKFILYDIEHKIGPDGTFYTSLWTLDKQVIDRRSNMLWTDDRVRNLWNNDRAAMEADFFRYLSNASKGSDEAIPSADLLNNNDGLGARRRDVLHQMLGAVKEDDSPYHNKPIAEIPKGMMASVTRFNIDRMTTMRTRAGERFDLDAGKALPRLTRNFSPADMDHENTSNGQILKHDTGFRFFRNNKSTTFYDNFGRNLGSFPTAEEATNYAKKMYSEAVDNQVEGGHKLANENLDYLLKFSPAFSEDGKQEARTVGDLFETNEMREFLKGVPVAGNGLTRQEYLMNWWIGLRNKGESFIRNAVMDKYNIDTKAIQETQKKLTELATQNPQVNETLDNINNARRTISDNRIGKYLRKVPVARQLNDLKRILIQQQRFINDVHALYPKELLDKGIDWDKFRKGNPFYDNFVEKINSGDDAALVHFLSDKYGQEMQTGKPIAVVATHGTSNIRLLKDMEFSEDLLGTRSHINLSKYGTMASGSQATSNAFSTAGAVRAVFLFNNPYVAELTGGIHKHFIDAIQNGHDGLIIKDINNYYDNDYIYVSLKGNAKEKTKIFESNQDSTPLPRGGEVNGQKALLGNELNKEFGATKENTLKFSPADEEEPIRLSEKMKTFKINGKYEKGEGNRIYDTKSRKWTSGFIGKYAEENPALIEGVKLKMDNWDKRTDDFGRRSIILTKGDSEIGRVDYEVKKATNGQTVLWDPTIKVNKEYRGKGYSNLIYSEMAERARFLGASEFIQRIANKDAIPMHTQIKTFGFGESKLIDPERGTYYEPTKENFDKLKNPLVEVEGKNGTIQTVEGYEPWVHSWSKIFSDRHYSPADEEGMPQPLKIKSELPDLIERIFTKHKNINANGFINALQKMGGEMKYKGFQEAKAIGLIDFISKLDQNKPLDVNKIKDYINANGIDLSISKNAREVKNIDTHRYVAAGTNSNYEDRAVRINPQYKHKQEGHFGQDVVVHTRTDVRTNYETGEEHLYGNEIQANNDDKDDGEIPNKIKDMKNTLNWFKLVKEWAIKNGWLDEQSTENLNGSESSPASRESFHLSNDDGFKKVESFFADPTYLIKLKDIDAIKNSKITGPIYNYFKSNKDWNLTKTKAVYLTGCVLDVAIKSRVEVENFMNNGELESWTRKAFLHYSKETGKTLDIGLNELTDLIHDDLLKQNLKGWFYKNELNGNWLNLHDELFRHYGFENDENFDKRTKNLAEELRLKAINEGLLPDKTFSLSDINFKPSYKNETYFSKQLEKIINENNRKIIFPETLDYAKYPFEEWSHPPTDEKLISFIKNLLPKQYELEKERLKISIASNKILYDDGYGVEIKSKGVKESKEYLNKVYNELMQINPEILSPYETELLYLTGYTRDEIDEQRKQYEDVDNRIKRSLLKRLNHSIDNVTKTKETVNKLEEALKQLEGNNNQKPLEGVKEWSVIGLKQDIERMIELGINNYTLTHPQDAPPHSGMDADSANQLYGKIIPSAWKEWLKQYNIELKQINPNQEIKYPWKDVDTRIRPAGYDHEMQLEWIQEEFDRIRQKKLIEKQKLLNAIENHGKNEEEITIQALKALANSGPEHYKNLQRYPDTLASRYIKNDNIKEAMYKYVKELKKEYDFVSDNTDPEELAKIQTQSAINRGYSFKLNDAIKRDFRQNKIGIYRSPADAVNWSQQQVGNSSIAKSNSGYTVMRSLSKYRVYNQNKDLVGVYDDEKTAMDKINKLSRKPNELR